MQFVFSTISLMNVTIYNVTIKDNIALKEFYLSLESSSKIIAHDVSFVKMKGLLLYASES